MGAQQFGLGSINAENDSNRMRCSKSVRVAGELPTSSLRSRSHHAGFRCRDYAGTRGHGLFHAALRSCRHSGLRRIDSGLPPRGDRSPVGPRRHGTMCSRRHRCGRLRLHVCQPRGLTTRPLPDVMGSASLGFGDPARGGDRVTAWPGDHDTYRASTPKSASRSAYRRFVLNDHPRADLSTSERISRHGDRLRCSPETITTGEPE
jgi:hypothetical protein